jgi:poly-gamma-glutamate synthesis protein (capsule biosynthesis protein)
VLVLAWDNRIPGAGHGAFTSSDSPAVSPAASVLASAGASPEASAVRSASPSPGVAAASVALAVVSGFDNYKVTSITTADLAARLNAGTLVVPCGAEAAIAKALGTTTQGAAACVAADRITAFLDPATTTLALLPPALVTPRVKVVPLGGADLVGEKPARGRAYPLSIATPTGWPAAWSQWSSGDVRVVVVTGVTCPDRGVSHQTVVLKKGWNWLLAAGTARYTGTHWFAPMGWWVVDAVRSGNAGALVDLLKNADITESDFECAMTKSFTQHDSGTFFSVDPRVAPMMAQAGFDVATIAADHNTQGGLGVVGETVDAFAKAGIQTTGGGRTLAEALKPAVIDAGGLKFGFVGFDAIGGSAYATATSPGVARLTPANAKTAIAEARAAGAKVIIALPQWSRTEYHADFTPFQNDLVRVLVNAGADDIVGADFHWAAGIAISQVGSTYRYVGASQGNFWFGQNWSRQTEEGVITSLTFVGTQLAQVRLTPTVVLDDAQVNLTNPATDGQFVLKQVLAATTLPSK